MSIATKRGDDGTTSLVFGRRVPKHDPRVSAYGTVDELNAFLGSARAILPADHADHHLVHAIQSELMTLMTEIAVAAEDQERWLQRNPARIEQPLIDRLDEELRQREARAGGFKGFDQPGESERNARFHLARVTCRRAERALTELAHKAGMPVRPELGRYLNRLSDLLWILAQPEA